MNERRLRLRLGLFVLGALVLMAVLIVLFGSLPTMFQRTTQYTVRFTDAPGVSPGTPVRRSGVRIGSVRDVTLDDERGIVRVQLAIDQRFSLRHNEQPTLIVGLLGSDATIDFIPQQPEEGRPVDRSPIEPGAEIVGVRQASVNTLLNRASEVVPTTQETLNDMRKSLQRLERMSPLMEDTMREWRDLGRATREMVPDVKQTNNEIRELARASRLAIPDLRRNADDVGALSRSWTKLGDRIDLLLQTNQEQIVKAIENASESLARLSRLLSEENTRNVTAIIRNTRLASDRLDDMSRDAGELIKQGRAVLTDMQKITKPLADRADVLVRSLEATLVNMQKATTPLADKAEDIVRVLEAFLINGNRLVAPLAGRAEPIARNLEVSLDALAKVLGPLGARSDRIAGSLEQALDRLNRTLGDVQALMKVLDQADGALRRFLTDPSLYIHLDEIICGFGRITPRIDRVVKDFEVFADKLARHPELLGIGGAVSPSSGLKGPPYPRPIAPPP